MFTFLSRFRRQTAVLTALALVASVLVAVPVSAADDPEADYTATFSACVGAAAEDAGFTDVPDGHSNAGDIDCIAYYGITKGTSASTYSPLMSVTREHMALFLTRLAGLVGIEVASDPSHSFTDVGDLSDESQTAIAQLADLGITQGTSDTTYSPADTVQRDHMALFISRLMNLMTPMKDAGSVPDDVGANDSKPVGSPFTDLDSVTKSAYDAISNLWELGVASGINDTHYGPSQSITRASMAGFMAGVLHHSNARPVGLTIQAASHSGFGTVNPRVVVSYRNENFGVVSGAAIAVFSLTEDQQFDDDGKCPVVAGLTCDWSENSDPTGTNGNIDVATEEVAGGSSRTWYAWMGDDDNSEFDADTAHAAMVTISSEIDATGLKVTSDINENNAGTGTEDAPEQVNLDTKRSVTFTVQLVQGDDEDAVAKSGQEITVQLVSEDSNDTVIYRSNNEATLTTDGDGTTTFTLEGPSSQGTSDDDAERTDTVQFLGVGDGATVVVLWADVERAPNNAKVSAGPEYQIIADNKVGFRVTYRLYDQYGDPIGSNDDEKADVNVNNAGVVERPINDSGIATYSATVTNPTPGTAIEVSVGGVTNVVAAEAEVMPLTHAVDDTGIATDGDVGDVYADDNRFRIGGALYTYDSDDTFLIGNSKVDMDKFEKELDAEDTVDVLVYDDDGTSIFRIQTG